MNPNFLTAGEVANLLRISRALAYRLISKGEIASVRFGRTVRVREEDLNIFIKSKLSASVLQSGTLVPMGTGKTQ